MNADSTERNTWRRTDFRLVCATNRDLLDLVRSGGFRADLYCRIASFVCKLPALRERPEDIVPLAKHFLRQAYSTGETPNRWHLDEMVVRIAGERMYLWRAVDHDMLVQRQRDGRAALRLMRKLLKKQVRTQIAGHRQAALVHLRIPASAIDLPA